MTLKTVGIAGWLADVVDNFDSIENTLGNGVLNVARFTFDTAVAANKEVGAHGTGVTIPANAIIVGGFFEVNTGFTSENSTATIAISVKTANDLQTATAISNAIFSTAGLKAVSPVIQTLGTAIKLGASAKEITCTVAVEALTAGKLNGYLYYLPGDETA